MKSYQSYLLSALALGLLIPLARAEKGVKSRRVDDDLPHRAGDPDEERVEKEKVTFLGIETVPADRTLGAQLGQAKDTGLVVTQVLENSPAAGVLKEDDMLIKLDDQLLINMPQLRVLIRSKKEGDEIKLTLVRAGKEISAKVKLAVREMPKLANAFFQFNGGPQAGFDQLREMPGMGPDGARDVMRMIEHERGNFMTRPRVHVTRRLNHGSTVVDIPKSDVFYSDDEGSIDIKSNDGKRNLTFKNSKGEIGFTGPIDTEEERSKLPPEIRRRLEKLETDTMNSDVNDDFQSETIPLPGEAGTTKIVREMEPGEREFRDQASASF